MGWSHKALDMIERLSTNIYVLFLLQKETTMTTFKNIYLFIWLHQVIAVACKLLVAVMWDLVP